VKINQSLTTKSNIIHHRSLFVSYLFLYIISLLLIVDFDKSKYSLVIVPQLDVSVVVVFGKILGDKSRETVLANVGHKLSALNVE
jgi:hypothetical protein